MGTHDELPPIPSDEELAELAAFAAEHPDPRPTESEVADGEPIEIPLRGFGSPTYGYGVAGAFSAVTGVEMIEDSSHVADNRAERERLDDEGIP